MLRIKIIEGIPCIVLEEDDSASNEPSKKSIEYYEDKSDFTTCQKSKEDQNFKDVLDELKKKFKE